MRPRSRFITILSVSSLLLLVILFIQGLSDLFALQAMERMEAYRIAQELLPSLQVSTGTIVTELALYLAGIVASIGMYNRLQWGRRSYIAVLTAITVWSTVSSVMTYINVSGLLREFGAGPSLPLLLAGSIAGVLVNGLLLWKLTRRDVREEFSP